MFISFNWEVASMVESDFLDDTGHQIPVQFSQDRLLSRVVTAARGILG